MTPEELIGPAAAKALAEHFVLTPIAKPLPEVVTMEEAIALSDDYKQRIAMPGYTLSYDSSAHMQPALSAFVLRWLRARLEALPNFCKRTELGDTGGTNLHRADTFKALTGREWTP